MNDEKFASIAKTMRFLPFFLGALFLLGAFLSFTLKFEDMNEKWGILFFMLFGLGALLTMTMGYAFYALLWKSAQEKEAKDEEEELD